MSDKDYSGLLSSIEKRRKRERDALMVAKDALAGQKTKVKKKKKKRPLRGLSLDELLGRAKKK